MKWKPSFLVSYVNLKSFVKNDLQDACDEWVLDSGAYSALTSGAKIDLARYTDDCLSLMQSKKPPAVIFSLDVIGDPERSLKNADAMRRQGVNALATFHFGSPWHYITDVAKRGRCAFGGLVARGAGGHGTKLTYESRLDFLEQCFARVWPVWAHGFGCLDGRLLSRVPLASADSTTWTYGLSRYGTFQYLGLNATGITNKTHPKAFQSGFRGQIEHYKQMERTAQQRWSPLFRKCGFGDFRLRYVVSSKKDKSYFREFSCAPS